MISIYHKFPGYNHGFDFIFFATAPESVPIVVQSVIIPVVPLRPSTPPSGRLSLHPGPTPGGNLTSGKVICPGVVLI